MRIPAKRIAACMKYPNIYNNRYIMNSTLDCYRTGTTPSMFDQPENYAPYLRGGD